MNSNTSLTLTFLDQLPQAAAFVLQEMPAEQTAAFLDAVPTRIAAAVLNEMIPWHAARRIELLSASRAASVLRQISFADAITLSRLLRPAMRDIVYKELPSRLAARLDSALRYPPYQIGAWADPQIAALGAGSSVTEALRVLRSAENTSHLFIEDSEHGAYLGTIAVREILAASTGSMLRDLRIQRTVPLSNRAAIASVAFDERWDAFLHLPVVGRRGNLIGGLSRKMLRRGTQHPIGQNSARRHSVIHELGSAWLRTSSMLVATILSPVSAYSTLPDGTVPDDD